MNYVLLLLACTSLHYLVRFGIWLWRWSRTGDIGRFKKWGEWAVVTGCTDGIGLDMARALHKEGYSLILISRSEAKLREVQHELPRSVRFVCDYSVGVNTRALREVLDGKWISIFINNAGVIHDSSPFEDMVDGVIEYVMKVNLIATLQVSQIVVGKMEGGVVATISSGSSLIPFPYQSVYAASKAALNHWNVAMRAEKRVTHPDLTFQVYTPFLVATKLSGYSPTLTIPSSRDWVHDAMSQLGRGDTTGYIYHDMMLWVIQHMPESLAESYMRAVNSMKH